MQITKCSSSFIVETLMVFPHVVCSSLGQNLSTSKYVGEITFAIIIAALGLVLFALLIGNMQVSTLNDYIYIAKIDFFLFFNTGLVPYL